MKTTELCPRCGGANLEIKDACCDDKAKGVSLVKRCEKCGYKEILTMKETI
jgi:predicted nucleic-acid-binding Zn-ribbon protein